MAEPIEGRMLREHRRALHQIPELDYDLPRTLAYVRGILELVAGDITSRGGRATVFSPSRSALCLYVDRGTPHATALRSDMDALPVTERTGAAYASRIGGHMHACGHDGHMAMLLTLAQWLPQNLDRLGRSLLLVFQPAEETTGGARSICQSGALEECDVDRIFGLHLWPGLPEGRLAGRPGALLAAGNETHVTFLGRAAHIARAELGADAVEAAARFLTATYDHIERLCQREAAHGREGVVLKFGTLQGGLVCNQIADRARLEGSLRTFDVELRDEVMAEVRELAARAAASCGCTAEVDFAEGYPPVTNDPELFGRVAERVPELQILEEPYMIAEDFAWYQRQLPGVFLLLGVGEVPSLHSDGFDFDERALAGGLAALKALALMP